jgi:hypothetical protein
MLLSGHLQGEKPILPDRKTIPARFFLFGEGKILRQIGRFCARGKSHHKLPRGQVFIGRQALLIVLFIELDAEGFEELQILIADLEFGIGAKGRYQGSLVGGVFALLADADGCF